MESAKIRRYALLVVAALAVASMFPSFGGGAHRPSYVHTQSARYAAIDCGTYPSTSTYPLGRVTALHGVGCARALEIAKAYDKSGKQLGKWRCALAHGAGTALFSCGKGGHSGDLRRWPHALLARGEATPGG
jgi:hypothetical protein